MFVRFARFEGTDPATRDDRVEQMRQEIESVKAGNPPEGMPPEAGEVLRSSVVRVLTVVDHSDGTEGSAVFCATEEDLKRVDELLSAMSPPSAGDGHRVDVAHYEVVMDVEV